MIKRLSDRMRARLLAAHPDEHVRIWSFQDQGAWEAAQGRGYLAVESGWYEAQGNDEHGFPIHCYVHQYDYMREVMAERMPGFSGDYPVWGWLARPNLRQWCYFTSPTVMIVADVPRARVLLSDYDLWHMPLNNGACTWTEAEDDAFEAANKGTQHQGLSTPEIRATWHRVFDLAKRTDPEVLDWAGQCDRIQACIDRIYFPEIVEVRRVTGRLGRNGGKRY